MTEGEELVLGLVYPIGVDIDKAIRTISRSVRKFNYTPNIIRLTKIFRELPPGVDDDLSFSKKRRSVYQEINELMTLGNTFCERKENPETMAYYGIGEISLGRDHSGAVRGRTIHIVRSFKRPEEVSTFRKVYGEGFFLLGINASQGSRKRFFKDKRVSSKLAKKLMKRDEEENKKYGQQTRETFQLSDAFVDESAKDFDKQVERFLRLVFGDPYVTPTRDEHAMFLAYASSLRSADLSRQVGAVIRSKEGEIVSQGANDVPCCGGGLYWSDDKNDERDHKRGFDSNKRAREKILEDILERFRSSQELRSFFSSSQYSEAIDVCKKLIGESKFKDITEYGRATHAEMEALLCCARVGTNLRHGTLYTTTFPCHNCARHVIAAGIKRVVYVEPYAKSRAIELHSDAVTINGRDRNHRKVLFEPFTGIGPRRYFDLFSMKLGMGEESVRNKQGKVINFEMKKARPRVRLKNSSYLDREANVVVKWKEMLGQ